MNFIYKYLKFNMKNIKILRIKWFRIKYLFKRVNICFCAYATEDESNDNKASV